MARQLTQVYLEEEQKKALQEAADKRGSSMADELRRALEVYLQGVTPEELAQLDAASKDFGEAVEDIGATLDRMNDNLRKTFVELERIHGGPVKAP